MGPALERLLARPSALRLLRLITTCDAPAHGHNFSKIYSASPGLCFHKLGENGRATVQRTPRRHLSTASRIHGRSARRSAAYMALLMSDDTRNPLLTDLKDDENPFQRLRFEADVLGAPQERKRLVEQECYGKDLAIWAELVQFRKRLDANRGVEEIWCAMRQRELDLPTEGPLADVFWQNFIAAGCRRDTLLTGMLDYAVDLRNRTQRSYPQLYKIVVDHFLYHRPESAVLWHKTLAEYDLISQGSTGSVMGHAVTSTEPQKAFAAFLNIYRANPGGNLYDQCLNILVQYRKGFDEAYMWHKFLVSHGDHPSPGLRNTPAVQNLFRFEALEPYEAKAVKAGFGKASGTSSWAAGEERKEAEERKEVVYTREKANTMVGDIYGIKKQTLSDQFCARLFATGALPMDFIIGGVHMFGLNEIGPLALREIALRAQTTTDFLATLRSAKQVGLKVADTIFTRALRRIASEGRQQQFEFLSKSDRHPENYDDPEITKQLFEESLLRNRTDEAHALLGVLSMSAAHPPSFQWNLLLQSCCRPSEMRRLNDLIRDMRLAEAIVSDRSLAIIRQRFLRPRMPGRRPVSTVPHDHESHDDLGLVTNLFISVLKADRDVHPSHWRELMKRYGMTSRLDALGNLCIRLATHYSRTGLGTEGTIDFGPMSPVSAEIALKHPLHPLRLIFDEHMQRAIVAWFFKSHRARSSPRQDRKWFQVRHLLQNQSGADVDWLGGLALLRKLEGLGVPMYLSAIRKEMRNRLFVLYGPGSPRNRENLLARHANRTSFSQRLKQIEKTWGGRGLYEFTAQDLTDPAMESALCHSLFGPPLKNKPRRRSDKPTCSSDAREIAPSARNDFMVEGSDRSIVLASTVPQMATATCG